MDEADIRNSFSEIWNVKFGDVSLFYYNATLVTWFQGLDLVMFEYPSRGGRRLRIA
jgi:hypothetical protein